jgi:hypothetical protein
VDFNEGKLLVQDETFDASDFHVATPAIGRSYPTEKLCE